LQALRRDQIIKYSFAPVWFEVKDVEQATVDTNDARKQEILKKAEKNRADDAGESSGTETPTGPAKPEK